MALRLGFPQKLVTAIRLASSPQILGGNPPKTRSARGLFAAPHNVRFWHKADMTARLSDVRFRG